MLSGGMETDVLVNRFGEMDGQIGEQTTIENG